MRLVSFNVNGIRSRIHQLNSINKSLQPDILGLQEIKVDDQDFPNDQLSHLPLHFNHHGQKGHYGVALASKEKPLSIKKGMATDSVEAQKRLIQGDFSLPDASNLTVINAYFPQGESRNHPKKFPAKATFYSDLLKKLMNEFKPSQLLVVMGDFNVAPKDKDIGISEDAKKRWLRTGKTSFLPEEREWFSRLETWGLIDTFREQYPDGIDKFSWFDYRSRGFESNPKRGLRIDQILVTKPLFERMTEAGIDYETRSMNKPSDHCPVWFAFES